MTIKLDVNTSKINQYLFIFILYSLFPLSLELNMMWSSARRARAGVALRSCPPPLPPKAARSRATV